MKKKKRIVEPGDQTVNVSISMPSKLAEAAKEHVRENDLTLAQYIRRLLNEALRPDKKTA